MSAPRRGQARAQARPGSAKPSRPKGSDRTARYATREDQLVEVLEHIRRRNRKVYNALLAVLSSKDVAAFGVILNFVVTQAAARSRRTR